MIVTETGLKGLLLIKADCFGDQRGFFMETWSKKRYYEFGIAVDFVQDNLSFSSYGVLRGMHFQNPQGQGKLVFVLQGEVYDVAIDIRRGSPTFGKWEGFYLSGKDKRQLYIPEGFAHGYCVTSPTALFAYKCTNYYRPEAEQGILWNDPDINIDWPIADPTLSNKDIGHQLLKDYILADLPFYEE